MVCLVVCVAMAFADNDPGQEQNMNRFSGTVRQAPTHAERSGSCLLYYVPGDSSRYFFGWAPTEAFKTWIDPATNPFNTGCSAPFYPFHIDTLWFDFYLHDAANQVGYTFVFNADVECPSNVGTTYADKCNGPGAATYSMQISHLVTADDATAGEILIPVAINACVNGGFFYGVELVSWDGMPYVPGATVTHGAPSILSGATPQPSVAAQTCAIWYKSIRNIGTAQNPIWTPACWLDVVTGFTAPWGPWIMYAQGTAGADCTPTTCNPCPATRLGDTAENPLPITTASWTRTIPLCDYCGNYDGRDFIGNFTASGPDVVLELAFTDPSQACFSLTIAPECAEPTFFRIRSWMMDVSDPSAPYLTYVGTPNFPAFGQSQTYNFTAAGPNGCYLGDGINPIRLHLYIDTRGCCCPVTVTYNGDTPLPVEMSAFNAVGLDGRVNLTWQTRSESSVDHYVVTRNDNVTMNVQGLGDNPAGHMYNLVDNNVVNGTSYTYRLASVDVNGTVNRFPNVASATPMADVVTEYTLNQNYPNPFNPSTMISYAVKEAGNVTLKVYSVDGRLVSTLVNAKQEAGKYTISFDGSKLASGVYLYQLEANGFTATHKMVLMK
jgi:hypothetical protein